MTRFSGDSYRRLLHRGLTVAAVAIIATGCASSRPAAYQVPTSDPLEGFNRAMFAVNKAGDKAILRPLAKGYHFITPDPVEKGVSNFFANLRSPISILNNLLQGKFKGAFTETSRLVINSTLGLGGLMDPATHGGIEKRDEDFGQTMAVWGIKPGPYLVIPFVGPSSIRDGIGQIGDYYTDPLTHYNVSDVRDKLRILQIISLRASLLPLDKQLYGASDPYIFMRSSYVQNRNFKIFDGDPPEQNTDDDFGGEFDD